MAGNIETLKRSLRACDPYLNVYDYICKCRPVDLRVALDEIERLRAELDKCKAVAAETHDKWLHAVKMLTDSWRRLRAERPTCKWTRDGEVYDTGCGECFEFTDSGALADQPAIQWCPFCGGRIREAA